MYLEHTYETSSVNKKKLEVQCVFITAVCFFIFDQPTKAQEKSIENLALLVEKVCSNGSIL